MAAHEAKGDKLVHASVLPVCNNAGNLSAEFEAANDESFRDIHIFITSFQYPNLQRTITKNTHTFSLGNLATHHPSPVWRC